ncbi:MAG: succinate dehydrogenase cytochrome b subunit, partial [Bacteroidales bacterium]|nr:succinate dehydrogenase cytochrome b subunit [Bacteroidales bacterium]
FLLFHGSMNVVAIFSEEGYNMICEFLGANWYALVASMGLAALAVIHILYAFILSVQNYRARGNDRYAVTKRQDNVEWASKNMLILGIVIVCFLVMHMCHFWANMQLAELTGNVGDHGAADGIAWIEEWFSHPLWALCYFVGLIALWFHLSHGIWSALHTMGWNGDTWMKRVKCISTILATIIVLLFMAVLVYYFVKANCGCC